MAAIFPSRSSAAEFITDLPVAELAGVTRPQVTAMPWVATAIASAACRLRSTNHGRSTRSPRGIAANAQLGKEDEIGAGTFRPSCVVDDFCRIAREIADGGVDLAERNPHLNSVKGRDWGCQMERAFKCSQPNAVPVTVPSEWRLVR